MKGGRQRGSADEEQIRSKLKYQSVERSELNGESPPGREVASQNAPLTEWRRVAWYDQLAGVLGAEHVEVVKHQGHPR
jgi:hypothetical protein